MRGKKLRPVARRKTRYPAVEVEWTDTYTDGGWAYIKDHVKKVRAPLLIRSVGYLLERNARTIILTQQLDEAFGKASDTVTIPRGCVYRVRRLR